MSKSIRRVHVHRNLMLLTISLLALLLMISACGQKGPLHLQDQEHPEQPAGAQTS
jgi:predicted small lipoprotein YifL